MKRIIICPDGRRFEFDYFDLTGFESCMLVALCGLSKKVSVFFHSEEANHLIYKVENL